MVNEVSAAPELRRLPAVCRQTGLSASTIYRLVKCGTFPRPVQIGDHSTAWVGREVDEWVIARVAARNATAAAGTV